MTYRKPLPPEKITFCVYVDYSVVVEKQGKEPKARLYAQASGLDIFVLIEDKDRHPDCLNSMLVNACINRHIPTTSLHLVNTATIRTNKPKSETKEMF